MNFLENFTDSVFQTFKDRPDSQGFAKVFEKYDEDEFKRLNQLGCGIYFTPNFCKGGRKIENLTHLNCAFADLDVAKEGENISKEEIQKRKAKLEYALEDAPISPNFIIDTKNGLQPLWLLEDEPLTEESKIMFTDTVEGIIEYFKKFGSKGDQVKDFVRVLRLPNFYHMKGEPYLCHVKLGRFLRVPLVELQKTYKVSTLERRGVKTKSFDNSFVRGEVSQAIDKIDFQELVIRAFAFAGRSATFDKQQRLILDGRLTGTFQGKTGNRDFLASSSHEPFEGNRITVIADILSITNKEAYAWIKEQYGLNEDKLKAKKMVAEIRTIQVKPIDQYYSWGTMELTKVFAPIKRNTSTVLVGETGEGKSTFAFNMALRNADLGHKVLYISLEMTEQELLENIARSYAGWTVQEEVFNELSEQKIKAFKKKIEELKTLKNLTVKGIVGSQGINWEGCVQLMQGDWNLIFIDNLDLIQAGTGEDEWNRQKNISSNILNYCNDKQVPIVLLHHYRKAQKGVLRSMNDISGSAKIIHNAHRVIILTRIKKTDEDEELTPKQVASLQILLDKARGYSRAMKVVYFKSGTFVDDFETPLDQAWWHK